MQPPAPALMPPGPPTATQGRVWSPAGFWWRVLAWWLDTLILLVVERMAGSLLGLDRLSVTVDDDSATRSVSDIAYLVPDMMGRWHVHGWSASLLAATLALVYFTLMESSRWQGTLGKRICRLRVTDTAGGRISIVRALGRYLGKFVSAFVLGIGFLMVGWTRHKQGLHDLMVDTLVVRLRPTDTVLAFRLPD